MGWRVARRRRGRWPRRRGTKLAQCKHGKATTFCPWYYTVLEIGSCAKKSKHSPIPSVFHGAEIHDISVGRRSPSSLAMPPPSPRRRLPLAPSPPLLAPAFSVTTAVAFAARLPPFMPPSPDVSTRHGEPTTTPSSARPQPPPRLIRHSSSRRPD